MERGGKCSSQTPGSFALWRVKERLRLSCQKPSPSPLRERGINGGEGIFDCSEETIKALIEKVGLQSVEYVSKYTQEEAPEIYARGDVLVHLKHMDWTPNTVIEGMACGLPIVHAGNGGMNELVGEAGVSLDLPQDWDHIHTPEPSFLAEKIIEAYEQRQKLGKKARQIAVERYEIKSWVEAHRQIFASLLSQ